MNDIKLVETLKKLNYEVYQDEVPPGTTTSYNYVVYYKDGLRPGDKKFIYQVLEFVFVNEDKQGFDEVAIVDAIEKLGLQMTGEGSYGKLKKVVGGDIVDSLTLRFLRPLRRSEIY